MLAAGVIVGVDLAYWAEVLRFAGSMMARQQFLPGFTTDADEPRATWDPVFIGMDAGTACRTRQAHACGRAGTLRARCSRAS